ncbi:hypothetical protein B0H14DRAFT_3855863 [Mycena olivaceomarginata]|nr:hypothetical protein B0H14DRAFT_3855863 [Mycena olivaceomarginata]
MAPFGPRHQKRASAVCAQMTPPLKTRLGATGAGLHPDKVREDSKLASLIDKVRDDFPWWEELHAFWRELPNYNPVGVQSSEPGTDHAGEAAGLFDSKLPPADSDDADEYDDSDGRRSVVSMPQDEMEGAEEDPKSVVVLSYEDSDDSIETSRPSKPKKKIASESKPKVASIISGRDLGPARSKSSAAAKKKPQTAFDRLNDLREGESARLAEKRKLQHEEEMERMKLQSKKYELKLLRAQNEQIRLNRYATSQSPRRRTYGYALHSPSPSKYRSRPYSVASPMSFAASPMPYALPMSASDGSSPFSTQPDGTARDFGGDLFTGIMPSADFSTVASSSTSQIPGDDFSTLASSSTQWDSETALTDWSQTQ